MIQPGRKLSVDSYRYGFNGKENDNDVKGEGNQQDYGMRIYDPRLGRFLSVDPLMTSFPWNSPYSYAEGDPINYIDLDGAEKHETTAQSSKELEVKLRMATSEIINHQKVKTQTLLNFQIQRENLLKEYNEWRNNNPVGTPLPDKYLTVAPKASPPQSIVQGGIRGSEEFKIFKANYDTYGKYLPGISDVDDLISFANAVKEGKGDEATIFLIGFVVPEVSGKMLKGPLHHIFTDKNFIRGQQWSKKFAPMFEKAGYKLNDAINKINVLGHKGPHPEEYHEAVFDRLQAATKGLDGDDYKKAFESTLESLQKEVSTKGTALNKLLTKEK